MEIIERLKQEIEKEGILDPQILETGRVISVGDGVAKIIGLKEVENFEIIHFERTNLYGLAISLEEEEVGPIIFGEDKKIQEGDIVKRTKRTLSVPVGQDFVGRVINPLGQPIDGKGEIQSDIFYPLERIGPSVIEREPVNFPLHTGVKVLDALIPIGRGQRELILGDRITQKDKLVLDIIINQKNEPRRPIAIYVAIGQKEAKIARTLEILEKHGAMEYTIFVAAAASDPASFWYIAPYAGTALGEYFMHKG